MTLSFFSAFRAKNAAIGLAGALARRAQDALDEEREAAGEEDRRAPGIAEGQLAHDERGRRDPREDAEREPRILDEEAGDLPGGGGEPFHSALPPRASGAALREIRTTAAAAAARKSAAIPAIARSSPGQWNPRPSPTQNAPNAESTTALNAVTSAIASHSRRGCAERSAALSSAKASASSRRAITPPARRIAFLSQRIPKRSSSTPTASCMVWIGMRAISGPKASTSSARKASPARVPASAGRQPRTVPTASTMVSASTASTSEARKAEAIAGPAWARESMTGGKCSGCYEVLH